MSLLFAVGINLSLASMLSQQIHINTYMHLRVMSFILKKAIPYSQALRLIRICSENSFF